jgi:branched-chain amino acid transport system ATP-binding protein
MLLETHDLTIQFGGLIAVDSVNFGVDKGEIVGLIGPNGAGKTTVFNLITGILKPTKGTVAFDGKDVTGKKPHQLAKMGVGRTFQLNPLYPHFTVLENVMASYHLHPHSRSFDAFFNTPTYRRNEAMILEQSLETLKLLRLDQMKDEFARNLPHGHQKMLAVARALTVNPKLLLLDEPTSGMNWDETDLTLSIIEQMLGRGMSILLVEHNMDVIDICDRVVVMNFGRKIAEGTVEEIRSNPQVIEAYLGGAYAA